MNLFAKNVLSLKVPLFVMVASLLLSKCNCGGDYCEKQQEKMKDCIEEKQEVVKQMRGEIYPHDVDEAILKFDYEVARIYKACYPIEAQYRYNELYLESQEMIENKIARSEISYYIMNCNPPEIDRARSIAAENDMQDIFSEVVLKYLDKLVFGKKYDKALDCIMEIELPTVPLTTREDKDVFDAYWKKDGEGIIGEYYKYDQTSKKINRALDKILDAAINTGNNSMANRCVQMYKNSVDIQLDPETKNYSTRFATLKLVDTPQKEALKRLKEAGL